MQSKKRVSILAHRLKVDAWLDHYEVIVVRRNRQELLARVSSPRAARRTIDRAYRQLEVSRHAYHYQRAPGLHPRNAAKLCAVPFVLAFLLPWAWLSATIMLACLAIFCGLLTSGRRWMDGGEDDR